MNELAVISADALRFRIGFLETLVLNGLVETDKAVPRIQELRQELARRDVPAEEV